MSKYLPTLSQIQSILGIARLAPSVHNTQPWLVRLTDNHVVVSIDSKHLLTDGDPTGRQIIISLGIFTEAIDIGARDLGLKLSEVKLKNKEVFLSFESTPLTERSQQTIRLLRKRCSDRSIYKPAAISPQFISSIEQAASDGISVRVMTDREFTYSVASLTSKGIQLALTSPGFRYELSHYLVLPWSHKTRGISVKSLYIAPFLAVLQPIMLRLGIGIKTEAQLEKRRWESSSAIIAICGDGDLQHYWLEAGRTYLRISLTIQQAGLAQATSAALVEASNYHEDIEALLHTNKRILAMIRVGTGSSRKYYSPRISVVNILRDEKPALT